MPNSEDVRLKVDQVKNKKVEGTLYMMNDRMAWMPKHRDVFTLSFDYCDIKSYRVSSDERSKIRLQIVCHSEAMTTFHFCNSKGFEDQKKDRDNVSRLLQNLLPKFKNMMDQALEAKTKILNENKTVYQLYKDLVISGLVSAEDFWSKYVDYEKLIETTKKQKIGVSGAFLSNIRHEVGENGNVIYKLNTETAMSILRTYPAVREKFEQNVPTGIMTEKEFWRIYFQSHYYNMLQSVQSSSGQDLFSDCVGRDDENLVDEAKRASQKTLPVIAPETDDVAEIGYGVNENVMEREKKHDANRNLIKRFNFHSTMILKSALESEITVGETTTNDVDLDEEKVTKKFKPDDDLEELHTAKIDENQTLKLVHPDRYLRAPTIDRIQKNVLNTNPLHFEQFQRDLHQWQVNTELTLNSRLGHKILSELSPGGALMQGTTTQTLSQLVPQTIQEEMQTIYTSLSELLRHFWSSFPPSSAQIEEKIHRVYETIERFREKQVAPFKEKVSSDALTDFHLAGHMDDLIETAAAKYTQWTKSLNRN